MVSTKRRLALVLAALWALDGLMQLQPAMFTARFANDVLLPASENQPQLVAWPVTTAAHIILQQPIACDIAFALIQLSLAAGLIFRRTLKAALIGSVVWGLAVWWLGEGLGMMLTGQPTLLDGAPGPALLYAVLALAAWPRRTDSEPPPRWLKWVWAALWIGGAVLLLMPWNISNDALWQKLMEGSMEAPGWIAGLDQALANLLPTASVSQVVDLAVLQALIGVGVFAPSRFRAVAVWAGIGVLAVYWLVGQAMGELWTGLSTDPGTAPLIILIGLAILAKPAHNQPAVT